jgi:fructose-specific phosphotransferase system IIA component
MDLVDLVDEGCVFLDLDVRDKEDLIEKMVTRLSETGRIADPGVVTADILKREQLMSTGIGSGVAIPHAHTNGVRDLLVAFARTTHELDFDSLDKNPVRLVFLIIGPSEQSDYLRVLARISRLLYSGRLQKGLMGARDWLDVLRMIREEEREVLK